MNKYYSGTDRKHRRWTILRSQISLTSTKIFNRYLLNLYSEFDSSELNYDEWFQSVHPCHEPTSPISPAGPLISPDTGKRASRTNLLIIHKTPVKPEQENHEMFMSPNVSVRRPGDEDKPGGLRSKPMRILTRDSSLSKRSSMHMLTSDVSDMQMSIVKTGSTIRHTDVDIVTSPIRKFVLEAQQQDEMLLSDDNWTIGRMSSLPSLEGWLSSSNRESPPKQESPKIAPACGLRKFGMGAKAERIQIPTKTDSLEASSHPSPNFKRIKADTNIFTPLPTLQPPTDHPTRPPPIVKNSKKDVKIEDLKKILAEHNQRLRPRKR